MTVKEAMIEVAGVAKTFVLHNQSGMRLPVFKGVNFSVGKGECAVLAGPSGAGKSTLLRSIYANYTVTAGKVKVRHRGKWVDMANASPQSVLEVRRHTLGYVSQFLRVIPRVATRDIVAEPLRILGVEPDEALARAERMLARLNIPTRLWNLPPATFSGGEQQRINIAHGFIAGLPVLLLDEPSAALDADNRRVVIDLINQAKAAGAALIGIFHDAEVRNAVATRTIDVTEFAEAA